MTYFRLLVLHGNLNLNLIYSSPKSDLMERISSRQNISRFKTGLSVLSSDAFIKFYICKDPPTSYSHFLLLPGVATGQWKPPEQGLSANQGQKTWENSEPRIHSVGLLAPLSKLSCCQGNEQRPQTSALCCREKNMMKSPAFASCLFPFLRPVKSRTSRKPFFLLILILSTIINSTKFH